MRRAVMLVAVAACIPEVRYVKTVPYAPIIIEARRPDTTDDDLYASAAWFLSGDRDHTTRIIRSEFAFAGNVRSVNRTPVPDGIGYMSTTVETRYFHRVSARIASGQLEVFIDCARTEDIAVKPYPDCPDDQRVENWPGLATKVAQMIVIDADLRAERRARRVRPTILEGE